MFNKFLYYIGPFIQRFLNDSIQDWSSKCVSSSSKKKNFVIPVIAGASGTIILLIAVSFWIFKRKRKAHSNRGTRF